MQRHGRPFHPPNLALYARPLDAPHQPGGRIISIIIQCNDFNYLTNVETNDDSQTAKNIHEGIIKDAKTFNGLEKLMNFEDLDFKSTVLK